MMKKIDHEKIEGTWKEWLIYSIAVAMIFSTIWIINQAGKHEAKKRQEWMDQFKKLPSDQELKKIEY